MAADGSNEKSGRNLCINESFTIGSIDEQFLELKKFDDTQEFDNYYLTNGKLYCQGVTGPVYQFGHDRPRKILSVDNVDPNSDHSCELTGSQYILCKSFLVEFIVSNALKNGNCSITIICTCFSPYGKISGSYNNIELKYIQYPRIYCVGENVIISGIYWFSGKGRYYGINEKNFWGHNGWIYNGRSINNTRKESHEYNSATQSLIYHLGNFSTTVINGIINPSIVMGKFAIVFGGGFFSAVDISNGNSKLKIMSSMYTHIVNKNTYVLTKKIMIPAFIQNNKAAAIQVIEYDNNSKYSVTQYNVVEDVNYSPTDTECIICYHEINDKHVIFPCGHAQYCASCARMLVDSKSRCARCNCIVENFVKLVE